MKKRMVAAVMTAVLVGSMAAWAQGPQGDKGGGARGPGGGMGFGFGWILHDTDKAKELGVTDEQIATLREDGYKHQQEMIKLRADLELARMEIGRLVDADKPDTAAIDKAIDTVSGIEAQIEKSRVHFMIRVKEVLGEDTMAKIKAAMRARHDQNGRAGHACKKGRAGADSRDDQQGLAEPPQE